MKVKQKGALLLHEPVRLYLAPVEHFDVLAAPDGKPLAVAAGRLATVLVLPVDRGAVFVHDLDERLAGAGPLRLEHQRPGAHLEPAGRLQVRLGAAAIRRPAQPHDVDREVLEVDFVRLEQQQREPGTQMEQCAVVRSCAGC